MQDLFGQWNYTSTKLLLSFMELSQEEYSKCAFQNWGSISEALERDGYSFTAEMVLAHWQNLVHAYKMSRDHNSIKGQTQIHPAFEDQLHAFINYSPKRRETYERVVGRKVI